MNDFTPALDALQRAIQERKAYEHAAKAVEVLVSYDQTKSELEAKIAQARSDLDGALRHLSDAQQAAETLRASLAGERKDSEAAAREIVAKAKAQADHMLTEARGALADVEAQVVDANTALAGTQKRLEETEAAANAEADRLARIREAIQNLAGQ